jgi:diguanylate cyclase (GGDEF)-like protein
LDREGNIVFLALRHDITKLIEQEERIAQQLSDRLTGLPNRVKLMDDIEGGEFVAIGLLNLDAFQELNNLYGHKIGDEILQNFAVYLRENLNEEKCYLYKLPSDEFAILSKLALEKEVFKHIIIRLIHTLGSHRFLSEGTSLSECDGRDELRNRAGLVINANIALKMQNGTNCRMNCMI